MVDAPSGKRRAAARPGRPRDPEKDRAIINGARTVFFRDGFDAATIEDIAATAGVSKVTLYSRFADKAALFEAMVRAQSDLMADELDQPMEACGSIDARLNGFGVTLLSFLFRADHLALDRILSQEMVHQPDLAERFFEAGPGNCRRRLAEALAEAERRGELDFAREGTVAFEAADDLMALWKGFSDVEMNFGVISFPDADEIAARVRRGTRLFLKLYRSAA